MNAQTAQLPQIQEQLGYLSTLVGAMTTKIDQVSAMAGGTTEKRPSRSSADAKSWLAMRLLSAARTLIDSTT